ncbi:MAG: EamA family transporter [Pirellula sp.]
MNASKKPGWLPVLAALLTLYIVWGSTYLAIRVGVETFPPFLMGSARFAVAGVILLLFLWFRNGIRVTRKQLVDNSIGGFFMLLGGNGLVSWAEEKIPSGMATLVISLNPVFFVLAEWIIAAFQSKRAGAMVSDPHHSMHLEHASDDELRATTPPINTSTPPINTSTTPISTSTTPKGSRPNGWTLLGLIVGFAGLVILVGPGEWIHDENALDPMRVAALVMACVNWTIGSMYIRYSTNPAEPFTGAAFQMLFGAAWMLGVSWLAGELVSFHWSQISPASWWSWGYLVIAGSLVGYTSFVWLMKHTSPTLVSTYGYVNPMVAVFLGWWMLDESIGPRILIASLTIIVGVAMISLAKGRPSRVGR